MNTLLKPLYLRLNEKITPLPWATDIEHPTKVRASGKNDDWQIVTGDFMLESYKLGCIIACNNPDNNRTYPESQKDKDLMRLDEMQYANAQYTALAVNNLHKLAEALEGLAKMDNKDFANSFYSKEETAEQIMFMGKLAALALKDIS